MGGMLDASRASVNAEFQRAAAILEVMATEPVHHVERYDDGKVKLEGEHLDGAMHGDWAFYRRDGSLMRSGAFDRGRQVGVWKTFDRAGKLVKETDFGA